LFIFEVSALNTSPGTRFESRMPLVNGWRQWRLVQCCAKRWSGDVTKYQSREMTSAALENNYTKRKCADQQYLQIYNTETNIW